MQARFQRFCQNNGGWLPDYAMFNVLRRRFGYASWHDVARGVGAAQA